MSRPDGALGRLRTALGLLDRRPWLVVAGLVTTLLSLCGLAVAVAAYNVAGGLAFDLFATPSEYGGRTVSRASEPTMAAVRQLLTVALLWVTYLLARPLVGAPVAAAADRLAVGVPDPLAATRAGLRSTVGGALARGVARLGLWVGLTTLAVAVYLSVGTTAEAVGYALGVYERAPMAVTVGALALTALVGWVGATALLWGPGAVGRPAPGDPVGLRTGLRTARRAPGRAVADAVVVAVLAAVAPFVGVLTLFALDGAVGNGLLLAAAVAAAVLVGLATGSLAVAYRSVAVGLDRGPSPGRASGASARAGDADDSVLPSRRVLFAVALVLAAGVVGAGVRTADMRPTPDPGTPGPVAADAPPRETVERAVDAVAARDRTFDRDVSDRRVYDNGTTTAWTTDLEYRYWLDPGDRRGLFVLLSENQGNWSAGVVYSTPHTTVEVSAYGTPQTSVQAVNSVSSPAETPDRQALAARILADATPRPFYPLRLDDLTDTDSLTSTERALTDSFVFEDRDGSDVGPGWTEVDRGDDRVTYESTAPGAVATVVPYGEGGDEATLGTVRVTVDADTGYLRSATVTYTVDDSDPGIEETRERYRVTGVGETDVRQPDTVDRPLLSFVTDVLRY